MVLVRSAYFNLKNILREVWRIPPGTPCIYNIQYESTVYRLTGLEYTIKMKNYQTVSRFRRKLLPSGAEKKHFTKLVDGYKLVEATDSV